MDHYKVLGVHKNASKEEIKTAFRKLAVKFHPDKHSQSSEHLQDAATHKFKQLSEAYEILTDDRKRAEYNLRSNAYGAYRSNRYNSGYSGGGGYSNPYGYGYSNPYGYGYGYDGGGGARRSRVDGGMYIVDASGKALWKMRNQGKSFKEAMETVEKAKECKDSSS